MIILARSTGRNDADRLRNTCLMELLYATGMRVSELVGLPVSATRGDPRLLLILGKGGKERMVPLSPDARTALATWITLRDETQTARMAKKQPASKFLFPSRGAEGHLTRHRFYRDHELQMLALSVVDQGHGGLRHGGQFGNFAGVVHAKLDHTRLVRGS